MTTMELVLIVFLSQVSGFNCAVAPSVSQETNISYNQTAENRKDLFDPIDGAPEIPTAEITPKIVSKPEIATPPSVTKPFTTEGYPTISPVTAVTSDGRKPTKNNCLRYRMWRIYRFFYPRYPYNWTYGIAYPPKKDLRKVIPVYTNYFVMKTNGGKHKVKRLIRKLGYVYIRQIFPRDHYYLVLHRGICSRCKQSAGPEIKRLKREKQIVWVRQQKSRSYQLREIPFTENFILHQKNPSMETVPRFGVEKEMYFNDPYYFRQWYFHRNYFHHINVQMVWKAGYTGCGIRISVLDDGVHPDNPDLGENYDPSISYDYVHFRKAEESDMQKKSHGTSCAGIIAAVGNNSLCGVGIAYKAKVGGCRVLDGPVTDAQEAMALTHALDKVDIYSASWGPRDDGKSRGRPRILTQKAFIRGVTEGRGGKGAIYVWASGNGGKRFDNCNLDGYASSIYTISIGALTANGQSAYYSESCPVTLASTYIGGSHYVPTKRTLPAIKRMLKVVVPGDHGNCRQNFQGTSAAAPMAAGIIALLLQANKELTWRDVQHIIVKSSRIPSIREVGWLMNAAGYHYHIKAGFGVMDCGRMVAMAQNWTLVGPQRHWTTATRERRPVFGGGVTEVPLLVDTLTIPDHQIIDTLEHVIATLSIEHSRRGDLEIYLISPSNTVSQLLSQRPLDESRRGFRKWRFASVHFWGENPHGEWTLQIRDAGVHGGGRNFVHYFSLTLYGTFSGRDNSKRRNGAGKFLDRMAVRSIERRERLFSRYVRVRNVSAFDTGTNDSRYDDISEE